MARKWIRRHAYYSFPGLMSDFHQRLFFIKKVNFFSTHQVKVYFPPFFPLATPWWHLSETLVTPTLSCAHIHSLSSDWEGRLCPSKYFNFVSVCVFVCLSTVNSSILSKSSHFPFPYFVLHEHLFIPGYQILSTSSQY